MTLEESLRRLSGCSRSREYQVAIKHNSLAVQNKEMIMSRVCQVTGKRPMTGNNVSHANNKNRRRFLPNIHDHRFWVESEKRFVKLRVSAKGMRIIDKLGVEQVIADLRSRGQRV